MDVVSRVSPHERARPLFLMSVQDSEGFSWPGTRRRFENKSHPSRRKLDQDEETTVSSG